MDAEEGEMQVVDFPHHGTTLLEHLNKHRLEGKFCDISVHVQQCTFQAHKAVLAAASRYFHDQLLLKDSGILLLPDLLDPVVFERVLVSAYTGRLIISLEDIGSYLTVASFLQMWHVVGKCNEFIRKGCHVSRAQSSRSSDTQSPSSSNFFSNKDVADAWASDPSRSGVMGEVEVTPEHFQPPLEEKYFSIRAVSVNEPPGVSQPDACSFSSRTPTQGHPSPCIKQEGMVGEPAGSRAKKELCPILGGSVEQLIADTQTLAGLDFIDAPGVQTPCYGPTDSRNPSRAADTGSSRTSTHRPLGQLPHGPVEHTSRFGKKVFGCLCGKRFPEKGRRDRHVILRISMRPFACSLCNKKFKLKHHLGEHMLVHMDRPLHECGSCGKKFKLLECFQRHRENCEKLNSNSEATSRQGQNAGVNAGQTGSQGYS